MRTFGDEGHEEPGQGLGEAETNRLKALIDARWRAIETVPDGRE